MPTGEKSAQVRAEEQRATARVLLIAPVSGVLTALSSWADGDAPLWVRWLFTGLAAVSLVVGVLAWRFLRRDRGR